MYFQQFFCVIFQSDFSAVQKKEKFLVCSEMDFIFFGKKRRQEKNINYRPLRISLKSSSFVGNNLVLG